MQLVAAHRSALRQFDRRVRTIGPRQWHLPTPDTDWDVSALVDHLMTEQLWTPGLLAGQALADVPVDFNGDGNNLGNEPLATWGRVSAASGAAVAAVDLSATVHLSFGDVTAADYIRQLCLDLLVHAWDLARAIGADDEMPNDVTAFVLDIAHREVPASDGAGIFAARIPVPGCTADLTELLALTGRSRGWTSDPR